MKRFRFWMISLIAVALAVGLYTRRGHLAVVWTENRSLARHLYFKEINKTSFSPDHNRKNIVKDLSKHNPEIAAVIDIVLCVHPGVLPGLSVLAGYVEQFPDNQFFLYELAERCLQSNLCIDPLIVSSLADRLIALDPDNGLYCYLKAWALYLDRNEDDIQPVIYYTVLANNAEHRVHPYFLYENDAIDTARKAGFSHFHVECLDNYSVNNAYISEFYSSLEHRLHYAISDLETQKAGQIINVLKSMFDNRNDFGGVFIHKLNRELTNPVNLSEQLPQRIMLRRADLPEDIKTACRYDLMAYLKTSNKRVNLPRQPGIGQGICIAAVNNSAAMILILAVIAAILSFRANNTTGNCGPNKNVVISVFSCLAFSLLLIFIVIVRSDGMRREMALLYMYFILYGYEMAGSSIIFFLLFTLPFLLLIAIFQRMFLASSSQYDQHDGWTSLRKKSRVFLLMLESMFFAFFAYMSNNHKSSLVLAIGIFIINTMVISYGRIYRFSALRTFAKILTSGQEGKPLSTYLYSLLWTAGIYLFIIFLACPLASQGIEDCRLTGNQIVSFTPEPSPEAYNYVLNSIWLEKNTGKIDRLTLLKNAPCLKPKDLDSVLGSIRKISRYSGRRLDNAYLIGNYNPYNNTGALNDYHLYYLMLQCGSDTLDVFMKYIDKPESHRLKVARLILDDKSVKLTSVDLDMVLGRKDLSDEQYMNSFQAKAPAFVDTPVNPKEFLYALSNMDQPDELLEKFVSGCDKADFLDIDRLFPRKIALSIRKKHFSKSAPGYPNPPVRSRSITPTPMSPYVQSAFSIPDTFPAGHIDFCRLDEELCQMILDRICSGKSDEIVYNNTVLQLPYLDKDSSEKLTGLLYKRPFKSWATWQLRRLNYDFSEKFDALFLHNEGLDILGNLAFATGRLPKNERDAFVKLCAKLANERSSD